MSFLAQVLSSADKVNLEQINARVPEVIAAVDSCKSDVFTYLEKVYIQFRERPKQIEGKIKKINELSQEVDNVLKISTKLDMKKELLSSEKELKKYLGELERTNISLVIIGHLCKVHESLLDISQLQEEDRYFDCMQKIKETEHTIAAIPNDEQLEVLDELQLEVVTEKNTLLHKLSTIFKNNVIMKVNDQSNVMEIKRGTEQMNDVLLTLYLFQSMVTCLDHVTKFVWNHVFVPIVQNVVKINVNTTETSAIMTLSIVDPKKTSKYNEVFSNIKTALHFLSTHFNLKLCDDFSTLDYIGRDVRDNLSELIIKQCLQKTIPSTEEGLKQYDVVIADTKDLEVALKEASIFAEDTTSILEYANNIDTLFINKKCQNNCVAAQLLMKRDLHDMVEVGVAEDPDSAFTFSSKFPKCSVSRSVTELLTLAEKLLQEATAASDVCSGRLFCTVKNICNMYYEIVPVYHQKFLKTIPQQIGLFHNNCMYISYMLTKWNETYVPQLPPVLTVRPEGFTSEGRRLEEVATDMFTNFVSAQIKQLEEIMKDSCLSESNRSLQKVEPATEKCIRQCLRQQELLKTVWMKVLTYTLYNKTLGVILNSLCICIIQPLVKTEDISADVAEHLVETLKMVQTRGPKLFSDPVEVSLFVESWYKLSELIFVLGASLVDINDRWADGKGPLALQFKPEELRQLIRALFQNTDSRAALLSKIHD